jgi:PmbA protein
VEKNKVGVIELNLNKFIDILFQKAEERNINEYEVYFTQGASFSVKVYNKEVDDYKNAKTHGLSFRGIYNGKMGYSYTEVFDNDAIEMLVKELIENAELIENEDEIPIYAGSDEYKPVNNYSEALELVDADEKIEFTKKLEEYAKQLDNRVESVNYCLLGNSSGMRLIKNSKGLELESKGNVLYAYLSVVVKEDGDIKTGHAYTVTRDYASLNHEKLAKEAVKTATSKLGAKPVPTGEYKIIIENEAMSDILGVVSGIFSAEAVQKGLSKLKGKLNEKIAVDSLTIVDNPFLDGGFSNKSFDDEGVATSKKDIVKDGVLKTYLHNLKTAKKDNVTPTGNGTKGSYKSSIGIAPSNLYIEAKDLSLNEIMQKANEGVLITELAGLHSGFNSISGDFSLSAEGYYFKDGKIEKAVNQITIAGNFFTLLNDIEEVGSDLKFSLPGSSSIGSPSILIKKLNVAGS